MATTRIATNEEEGHSFLSPTCSLKNIFVKHNIFDMLQLRSIYSNVQTLRLQILIMLMVFSSGFACQLPKSNSHSVASMAFVNRNTWKKTASGWPHSAHLTAFVRGRVGSAATSCKTCVRSPTSWAITFRYTQLLSATSCVRQ